MFRRNKDRITEDGLVAARAILEHGLWAWKPGVFWSVQLRGAAANYVDPKSYFSSAVGVEALHTMATSTISKGPLRQLHDHSPSPLFTLFHPRPLPRTPHHAFLASTAVRRPTHGRPMVARSPRSMRTPRASPRRRSLVIASGDSTV